MFDSHRSVARLLTPPGTGGVHVFGATGPAVAALLDGHVRPRRGGAVRRGAGRSAGEAPALRRGDDRDLFLADLMDGDEVLDEVIVARVGTDHIEISVHGGVAVERRVRRLLADCGFELPTGDVDVCALADRGFEGGSAIAVEAHRGLREAWAPHAVLFFLAALEGGLARELESIAAALDGGGDAGLIGARKRLDALRRRGAFGLAMSAPPRVLFTGEPNVGKSSLFNALLGTGRAIVTGIPGTTRDIVEARAQIEGYPFLLADSAGIRETDDPLEALGVERAQDAAVRADIVVEVFEAPGEGAVAAAAAADGAVEERLVVINKIDRPAEGAMDALSLADGAVIPVSAERGDGLDELRRRLVYRSPFRGPVVRDFAAPFTPRQCLRIGAAHDALPSDVDGARALLAELVSMSASETQ